MRWLRRWLSRSDAKAVQGAPVKPLRWIDTAYGTHDRYPMTDMERAAQRVLLEAIPMPGEERAS